MLEISKVSYSYGGNPVFSDVSLSVAPGSFYFLTGPSGSGKTTFINLCAGSLIPEIGNISVFGEETKNMTNYELSKMRRRLGIVHQECEFLDHLSIEDNIILPLSLAGLDSLKERANVLELMKWVGLYSKSKVKPQELSGGEQQRAALARAAWSAASTTAAARSGKLRQESWSSEPKQDCRRKTKENIWLVCERLLRHL